MPFVGRLRRRRRRLLALTGLVVLTTLYTGLPNLGQSSLAEPVLPALSPEDATRGRPVKLLTASEEEKNEKGHMLPAAKSAIRPESVAPGNRAIDAKESAPKEPAKLDLNTVSLEDLLARPMDPMAYGTSARPPIQGLPAVLVANQTIELLLGDDGTIAAASAAANEDDNILRRHRVVFVGDVHGQHASLKALLVQIGFTPGRDHLVLTGDLVHKGPSSSAVVQLAMDVGASAVRGNHEDRVLVAYEALQARRRKTSSDANKAVSELEREPFPVPGDATERATAAELSPEQAHWLGSLPVILHLGRIAPLQHMFQTSAAAADAAAVNAHAPFQDVVVVHAGLVPSLPLAQQDPFAAMTMRSLVHPADEVRYEYARDLAKKRISSSSWRRYRSWDAIDVPPKHVEAEFHRLQQAVYGPDPRRHPHASPAVLRRDTTSSLIDPDTDSANSVQLPVETHFSKGPGYVHWAAAWNQAQHAIADPTRRTTVIYGHDALTGLAVPAGVPISWSGGGGSRQGRGLLARLFGSLFGGSWTTTTGAGGSGANKFSGPVLPADTGYTFGLDSGAVYGGALSALVLEADQAGVLQYRLEQVGCPAATKRP